MRLPLATSRPPSLHNVYAISDIHAEYAENMQFCEDLDDSHYRNDVLIVAGDVADSLSVFEAAMSRLVSKFGVVFFVPGARRIPVTNSTRAHSHHHQTTGPTGNHEMWIRRDGSEGAHSLEKWERLEALCTRLGVVTTPQRVQLQHQALRVCPLLSMHHASFDTEPDITSLRLPKVRVVMNDFRACRFPPPLELGSEALAEHFDGLNEAEAGLARSAAQSHVHAALSPWAPGAASAAGPAAAREAGEAVWGAAGGAARGEVVPAAGGAARGEVVPAPGGGASTADDEPILSFSHFLPRIELCPEKRFLVYPDLMKAMGSLPLGRRARAPRAPSRRALRHRLPPWHPPPHPCPSTQARGGAALPRARLRPFARMPIWGSNPAPAASRLTSATHACRPPIGTVRLGPDAGRHAVRAGGARHA